MGFKKGEKQTTPPLWVVADEKGKAQEPRKSCIVELPKQPGTRNAYAIAHRAMCDSDIVYGQAILINGWL